MIDEFFFHPGRSFNGFELERMLGEGAMGSVWQAQQVALRRPVAIKFLKPELARDPHARERFLREGQAAARVRDPHVVEVFDVGTAGGDMPYLVMEFLSGEDLRKLYYRDGAVPVEALVDLILPVCSAIQAAHEHGVIHRDLKPENILLARGRDGARLPKVVDFGISRLPTTHDGRMRTAASAVMGTPGYMAPEQARGAAGVDARADQYAIGVILFEGLVGAHPFEHDDPVVLLARTLEGRFTMPRALRPELPAALEAVVVRAMAQRPDDRFASMRDLGRALLPFASERTRVIFAPRFGPPDAADASGRAATRPVDDAAVEPDAPAPEPEAPRQPPASPAPPSAPTSDVPPTSARAPAGPAPLRKAKPERGPRALPYALAIVGALAAATFLFHLNRHPPPPQAAALAPTPVHASPRPAAPAPPPAVAPVATAPPPSQEGPPTPAATPLAPRVARPPRAPIARRSAVPTTGGPTAVVRTPGGSVVE